MQKHPLGIGPNQFGFVASDYGFHEGKLADSVWMELGAELGFIGLRCLLVFFGLCSLDFWPLTRDKTPVRTPGCVWRPGWYWPRS